MRLVIVLAMLVACDSNNHWKQEMRPGFPTMLCGPDNIFRTCFTVDEATCKAAVREAVEPCLAVEPDRLDLRDADKVGERVGNCIGTAYSLKFADKVNDSQTCRDLLLHQD